MSDGRPSLVMRRLDTLGRLSDDPRALTRLYLNPAHKAAVLQMRHWMEEAGMTAEVDAAASVVGRYEAARPGAPTLLLGSHIDTVPDAGKYDGTLGVVVAVEAVRRLHERGERLPFALEVLAFGDEEGVRFPVTLTGSRALAGTLDPAALDARDAGRVTLREALEQFGCDPAGIPALARRRDAVLGYVEVHIEQGPVLASEGLPLGVVTAINGAYRYTAEVRGVAGHAGTVPMSLRRDALAAAAEMVLLIERAAIETPELRATVGRMEALPGVVNVIPAAARFTIDLRSSSDAVNADADAALRRELAAVAARRGVTLAVTRTYEAPAVTCAPWLVDGLAAAVARAGQPVRRLASGAGHDGLAVAALCPVGMLFVRCGEGGISHNPAESIAAADAELALEVLLDFLRRLDPPSRRTPDALGA